MNDVVVNSCPESLSENPTDTTHTLHFRNHDDFTIAMVLRGTISYFPMRKPTTREYQEWLPPSWIESWNSRVESLRSSFRQEWKYYDQQRQVPQTPLKATKHHESNLPSLAPCLMIFPTPSMIAFSSMPFDQRWRRHTMTSFNRIPRQNQHQQGKSPVPSPWQGTNWLQRFLLKSGTPDWKPRNAPYMSLHSKESRQSPIPRS